MEQKGMKPRTVYDVIRDGINKLGKIRVPMEEQEIYHGILEVAQDLTACKMALEREMQAAAKAKAAAEAPGGSVTELFSEGELIGVLEDEIPEGAAEMQEEPTDQE